MLEEIKKKLRALLEIRDLLIELARTIARYPLAAGAITLIVLGYFGLHWLAFSYPAGNIDAYYDAINGHRVSEAWEMIAPAYREQRWKSDYHLFEAGYSTTSQHGTRTVKVISDADSYWPLPIARGLFTSSLTYEVSFVATDRFTRADCLRKTQEYDCAWLKLKNDAEYYALMARTLKVPEAVPEPSLQLTRSYKKRFTIHRLTLIRWEIVLIDTTEEGLRRDV